MSSVEDRPYAGTWKLNNRSVVKYTPDALVFINGDTSVPGCPRCRGRIDVQKFITSMNIEAGTSPSSHSANINLALPRMQGQQVFVDGHNLLRPGLEVHIFMRGYFPVRGMFKHLADPQAGKDVEFASSEGDKLDLSKYATYPYYPVFHGVVTQVSYEYSDGFYHGAMQCASLLHFWQFQNFAAAGAWFAQSRPNNDKGRPTLYGHNFNGVHPFGIIYTLYKDVTGAAGGVEFALSEASNLDAPIAQGDRQIYDQMALYWEQRFKTRIQSLRMYGVNGQLFNAAQQAWLAGAESRDLNRLLPSPSFNDSETLRTEKDPFSQQISVAKALGFGNAGLDFTYSPLIQEDGELTNLSILDMTAFTQAVGEFGPGDLWQTTYQTKMDIAHSVMEVTGYEFYQDVDGDLVFKPPFYNLDTSSNRYYRLADVDIINITFVEKEPTATYIIVRGSWFEGMTGVAPNEGALGKRGLYVDFKLVAKFGWRPGPTLDITYKSDPKVLFWIGVARLDMLNVDTFSASCTIPIRAELRPGYPVYIPFCDCYYYISQLSHQFTFGGQCTTGLTLTCRRAKWHAPGELKPAAEGQSAISLIHLDRPDLPPRPLEVIENGIPRIVGFPNVVMALDPRKFDPNFSPVGVGIDYFDGVDAPADLLMSLLQRDISTLRAFKPVMVESDIDGRQTVSDPGDIKRYRIETGEGPDDFYEFGFDELVLAFDTYRKGHKSVELAQTQLKIAKGSEDSARGARATFERLERQQAEKAGGNAEVFRGLSRNQAQDTASVAQEATFKAQSAVQEAKREELARLTNNSDYQLLAAIFDALQPQSNKPIRRKVDGIAGSDVTASWFESLTHLKGQYMATSVVGQYRYFSCSHPFEDQQGMPIIEWDDGQREKVSSGPILGQSIRRVPRIVSPTASAEVKDLINRMQDTLDALGIDWITANAPFSVTSFRGKKTAESLLGPTVAAANKNAQFLDSREAQNLVDIATAVNTVRSRALADPQWPPGQQLFSISAYRPQETSRKLEALHGEGLAIDLQIIGSGSLGKTAADAPTDVKTAFGILQREAMIAYSEGLITGIGSYQSPVSANGFFVHMDRRDVEALENVAARKGKTPPKEQKRSYWFETNGKLLGSDAAVQEWSAKKKLYKLTKLSFAITDPSPMPLDQETNLFLPKGGIPNLLPTPAPPTSPPVVEEISQGVRPSIETRELNTAVDRYVVQFKTVVTQSDASLRAPEVELGVGTCRKGIQITLGPQRTPQVLTTDQIQTISFVRHQASKFVDLIGTSMTAGRSSFCGNEFQKQLYLIFQQATQALTDPDQTVDEIFGPLYSRIAEDLFSVTIPVYSDGTLVSYLAIFLPPFPDAIQIALDIIPESMQEEISPTGIDPVSVDFLTFTQMSSIPGYTPIGTQQDDGRWFQRAADVLAGTYAGLISKHMEDQFLYFQTAAFNPSTDREKRIAAVQEAFNEAGLLAFGEAVVAVMLQKNTSETKTPLGGKVAKPLHSPVFPVSDEKGYEHYGAYRYGRGLSVEPGGTFESLHMGGDPFKNVTAQTAEEFLRAFTLVKSGRVTSRSTVLAGYQDARLQALTDALNKDRFSGATAEGVGGPSFLDNEGTSEVIEDLGVGELGITQREKNELESSIQSLADTITLMGETSDGQDGLRALLTGNGDNPDLLYQDSFDIKDSQFVRNFVNFAANYGKSPVFKTTVANAAYQLSDLTAHLMERMGESCVCRGSQSDVLMTAYARRSFVTVEGIDQKENPAVAFASEQIIQGAPGLSLQQRRYRGSIKDGNQPDAKTNPDGLKNPFGT